MPSIQGADDVVLEDGYPAHAQTFLDMRDIGFANHPGEAAVPGSRPTSATCSSRSTRARPDAQGTLDAVADLVADNTGK